jgi:Flp pilus assembly pilin Flp
MMDRILANKINRTLNNKGQGMVEYVLILALIALAVVASLPPIGKALVDKCKEFAAIISSS